MSLVGVLQSQEICEICALDSAGCVQVVFRAESLEAGEIKSHTCSRSRELCLCSPILGDTHICLCRLILRDTHICLCSLILRDTHIYTKRSIFSGNRIIDGI